MRTRRYPSQRAAQQTLATVVAGNASRVVAASDAAVASDPVSNPALVDRLQQIDDRLAALE